MTAHFHLRLAKIFNFTAKISLALSKWLVHSCVDWCHQQVDYHLARTEKEIKRLEP